MHSSRMRTARLLPVSPSMHCAGGVSSRGCLLWGCLLQGGVCSGDVCSGGCLLLGGVCLWSWGVSTPGVSALGGVCSCGVFASGPGVVSSTTIFTTISLWTWGGVSQHSLVQTLPPVNWTTDRCKNLTLQTSFASGKNSLQPQFLQQLDLFARN